MGILGIKGHETKNFVFVRLISFTIFRVGPNLIASFSLKTCSNRCQIYFKDILKISAKKFTHDFRNFLIFSVGVAGDEERVYIENLSGSLQR